MHRAYIMDKKRIGGSNMRECKNCRNLIPGGMRICPHCGTMPKSVPKQFYLYAVLTVIAAGSAVYFRPFAGGAAIGSASPGMLIASFAIFILLAVFFLAVSLVLIVNGTDGDKESRFSREERKRFAAMQQHIRSQHHFYEDGKYCSVCGHRKE